MEESGYYSRREGRDVSPDERHYSKSGSLRMQTPEKAFHVTMHQALLKWKAELEENYEQEMDLLEGKHQREMAKLRRSMMATIEADKAQAIEEMRRQDKMEIEKLREEVNMLKKGWKKDKAEWQLTKTRLAKDLDPTVLF
jgi:hypothetical protein